MAYAEEAKQTAARETLIGVISDFDNQFHRLAKLVQHLGNIADRIEGGHPLEAMQEKPDTPPHSTINDLVRKRDTLQMLCSQLEDEALRLDRGLGIIPASTGPVGQAGFR